MTKKKSTTGNTAKKSSTGSRAKTASSRVAKLPSATKATLNVVDSKSGVKTAFPKGGKGNRNNRIIKAIERVSFNNSKEMSDAIKNSKYRDVELAPAFQMIYRTDRKKAIKLAEAYAVSLPSITNQRELFLSAALMEKNERLALIRGYRNSGMGKGVVHAISQLPRMQARQIMKDFIIRDDKTKDEESLRDVLLWLRDAGRKMNQLRGNSAPDEEMDSAVVEFFEDVGDAISDAVTAVVDAVVETVESIGQAIADVVNWVAEDVKDLVNALFVAGKTILDLLKGALETGYDLVKKIVQGIIAVGKAMKQILEEAAALTKEFLITVLKAIDNLGHTLGELLEWMATKAYYIVHKFVDALIAAGKSIGNILSQAAQFGYTLICNTVETLLALGNTVVSIVKALATRPASVLDAVILAFRDLGKTIKNLFDEVISAGADLLRTIAESAARIGTSISEFMAYVCTASAEAVKNIVQGLISAGMTVVDMVATIGQQSIKAIHKIVAAVFELGRSLGSLLIDVAHLGMDLLKAVVKAAFRLGKTMVEFTGTLVRFTYKAAARFIEAALAAGATVAAILDSVASAGYFVFRKMVNGILQALGPVGDIFEWLIARGEHLGSTLWRETVLAINYVKKSITEIMDWAMSKTKAIFDTILRCVEDIGVRISDVVEWAQSVGDTALQYLGEATIRVGNSIAYILNYLEKDFVPGIAAILQGALNAGYAISTVIGWMATRSIEIVHEVVKGALDAGVTLATLISETIKHPSTVLENLLKAASELGKTMADVFQAVINETGQKFLDEVVPALVEIGTSVRDMLYGVLEVAGGAIGTVIAILFEMLGTYRPLTEQEKADAREVFGTSIDLDNTFIACEGVLNTIVFGVQDFFSQLSKGNFSNLTDETDSRAFVTGNLINFDVDEDFDRPTFIHELTHVWQNQHRGPVYLSHAIAGQIMDGYNYGYNTNDHSITIPDAYYDGRSEDYSEGYITGEGGADELLNADGNFKTFNPEQQGQIAMHYFVRKVLLGQDPSEYAPWQTYADVLQAGIV